MARNNAALGLKMRASSRATVADQLDAVGRELSLGKTPQRIECFDVSHSMGESAVASCVVLGPEGPLKSDYRRFNLRNITPGDDYAGIEQAVERRFARVMRGEAPMPDLLLIDGGLGQLHAAMAALARAGVADLAVVSVAKGSDRRAGQERLFFPGQEATPILADGFAGLAPGPASARRSASVRDHRSPAITRSSPARVVARRDSRPGAEAARELLKAFGGLQGIRHASVEDLARVHGMSRRLAAEIYQRMNPGA